VTFNPSTRSLRIKGPIPDDQVILTSFAGSEAVSRLFSYQLEFLSTKLQLTAKDLIGQPVLIEVAEKNVGDRGDADVRNFHGYITKFSAGSISPFKSDAGSPAREYRAEVAPWLWFLTRTAKSHIYFPDKDEKSIYEIVEEVMNRAKSYHVKVDWDGGLASSLKSRKVKHCA
jgi:type VI secretion system secreted protein VgrG